MKQLFVLLLIIALAVVLVIGGCTQPAPTTPPGTTPPATSPTPTATTLTPKYGGILRTISTPMSPIIGWPPEIAQGSGASGSAQESLETLLRGDKDGNIVPWLAESYKVADDLKSITIKLRKGIKFHDGSDLNAEVVKWNLENMIASKVAPFTMWASVDIIDDYTVRVNFSQWQSTLPMSFAEGNPCAPIISKAAFDKNGLEWVRLNPIGTGPFKFVSFTQDVGIKYVRNPDYWVEGKPYLDGIEYKFIADLTTQKMVMQAGEADMHNTSGAKAASEYSALGFNVEIVMEDTFNLAGDTANADSPWANKKVREAVEYAIDREAIAKGLGYGYLKAPYQIPPRASTAYDPNFALGRKYDPEKAKQLLAEAGYPNGFKTTIHSFPNPNMKDSLVAAQADLAKVGIQVDLDFPADFGKWMTFVGMGTWPKGDAIYNPAPRFDINFIGGVQFMFNMMGQSWARPPELTQAFQAALAAPKVDVKLVRAVTDMMTRDALLIPVSEGGNVRIEQPYVVAGYNERFFMAFYNTEDWWLNK